MWLFRNGVHWCQPVGDMAGPKRATGVSFFFFYRSFCRTRMCVSGGRRGKLDFALHVAPFLLWLVTASRTPLLPLPFPP